MSWNYNSWDQNWRQSQWKSDDQWNEDKSNASSAWDWQQPKRQSEADWSTSTPKKLRTENYQSKWDHIGSPTGYPPHVGSSVDKNLPPTFQSDSEFYDKNEIWGKKLPRKVMTTEWSKSHGLAGRDLTKVSLPELLYMGSQNHGLRYLGQGWFTGAVLTRNIRESVLVEKVLKQDIDGAALHVAKTSGHTVGPNMTNAEKANLIDLLAQHILAPLQTNKEVESEMLDLRRQLEEAQITIGKLQSKQAPLPEPHQDEKDDEPTPAEADGQDSSCQGQSRSPKGRPNGSCQVQSRSFKGITFYRCSRFHSGSDYPCSNGIPEGTRQVSFVHIHPARILQVAGQFAFEVQN